MVLATMALTVAVMAKTIGISQQTTQTLLQVPMVQALIIPRGGPPVQVEETLELRWPHLISLQTLRPLRQEGLVGLGLDRTLRQALRQEVTTLPRHSSSRARARPQPHQDRHP